MIRSKRIRTGFFTPFVVWAAVFVIIPLLLIVGYGITDQEGKLTLSNFAVMGNWEYQKALWLSVSLSLIATLICLIVAYPLCMILSERKLTAGSEIVLLFILPLWMNSLLSTMAWQTILEKNGLINQFLRMFGFSGFRMINTKGAIILGMVYNFLPYMILPLYNSLCDIDRSLIEASEDLGAGPVKTFVNLIFPLSVSGVISGITLVFIPSLTTFVISSLLGGGKILLIGNIIDQEFTVSYDWHMGSALSMVLMIFIIINLSLSAIGERVSQGGTEQ